MRALVRALKFGGAVRLVDAMAAQMAANAPPSLLARVTLVPVPIHRVRRRRRGFNQAEELARALAARTGLPVSDCLERPGGSARAAQVGRGRGDRLAAPGGIGAHAPRLGGARERCWWTTSSPPGPPSPPAPPPLVPRACGRGAGARVRAHARALKKALEPDPRGRYHRVT